VRVITRGRRAPLFFSPQKTHTHTHTSLTHSHPPTTTLLAHLQDGQVVAELAQQGVALVGEERRLGRDGAVKRLEARARDAGVGERAPVRAEVAVALVFVCVFVLIVVCGRCD
jgi:hypothetical protein